jgi:hypothetical protein
MKKQSINSIAKQLILGSLLSVVILLSAQSNALAASNDFRNNSDLNINKPKNIFIKYVGSTEDGFFFNVKYNNEKGQDFDIAITDERGEILYEGSFNDKLFDKKFLLPEDSDASLVSISIKTADDNFVKNYSVKSDVVKNVMVNKN